MYLRSIRRLMPAWLLAFAAPLSAHAGSFAPDLAALEARPGTVVVDLPTLGRLAFATTGKRIAPGMLAVRGVNARGERLSLFASDGQLRAGALYTRAGSYELVRVGGALEWREVRSLPAGVLDLRFDAGAMPGRQRQARAVQAAPAKADGNHEIDVLVLYTDEYAAARESTGGAAADIHRLVHTANVFFENSGVPVRYRLVGIERYTGAQDRENYPNNLALLPADPQVRELRDRYGADLVSLLLTTDTTNFLGGRAMLFNAGVQSDPPADSDPELDAFSVLAMGPNAQGLITPDWVFAHELGHNMGGGHNTSAHPTLLGPYWKPYAHATNCLTELNNFYRTIMHAGYDIGLPTGSINVTDQYGDFFSRANTDPAERLCVTLSPAPALETEADNARSITEAAPYVAGYRNSAGGARGAVSETASTTRGGALPVVLAVLGLLGVARRPAVRIRTGQ